MAPSLDTCIAPTIAMLDASLELNRSGVYVSVGLVPGSNTYASVAYAVRIWSSAKNAEIVIRELPGGLVVNDIEINGTTIASLFVPAVDRDLETVVVEVQP